MKFYLRLVPLLIVLGAALLQSCTSEPPTDLTKESIIPKPVSVTATGKGFSLKNPTIFVDESLKDILGSYLSTELNRLTGITSKLASNPDTQAGGNIYLVVADGDAELGTEGYELSISEDSVTITANKPAGVFYGIQTLLQVVPLKADQSGNYSIATGTIRDYPTWGWRGSMLDVARHFFSVEDVKRYIDMISYYKTNILHLHLTDDQGWRIEIKSWPNVAIHGGATQVDGGKGGYYTQEQYKEIVAYAAARYITIVPEIDMPSHSNAVLASYGELNNPETKFPKDGNYAGPLETKGIGEGKDKPTDLYTGREVGWSTLSLSKPNTMKFVNDVIRELAEITPGPYIHIGGDEAHVTKKEDYIEFINRFSEILKANGKQMIGWEEIAQANIDGNAIAQHWASEDHAKEAAAKGAKIIMSPSKKVYLDMKYDSLSRIGYNWAAYIEVDDAYNWDPATRVPGINKEQILGVEAPLWGETLKNMDDVMYLLFPRHPGIAEIGWSPAAGRSWEEYKVRLGNHGPRMKAWGIDYYRSNKVQWSE